MKWRRFPRHWPFVRGIHWSPVNSTHKGQWRGALFSLLCAWTNCKVNNRDAGDLTRHCAQYGVTVMKSGSSCIMFDLSLRNSFKLVYIFFNNVAHSQTKPRRWKHHRDDVIKWKHFPSYWPFVGDFTGHWWIPSAKASGAELWYFLWSAPDQTVEQTIETPVIWDAIALIVASL